eukprot:gnl/MRDRNA2_/MRDRNA2_64726_c0_seq2.p1 gnl/MRDRNA2_/MRDRNA2_64726_c0~~gnl/MRDRNA2_/MRDRNA2_64726_c0_seq2.p1  ORF type:complete len:121 (+),score=5.08 gnl/MRDRNA2_/MRDRNA2_64726_c0_seq2:125-487(+)
MNFTNSKTTPHIAQWSAQSQGFSDGKFNCTFDVSCIEELANYLKCIHWSPQWHMLDMKDLCRAFDSKESFTMHDVLYQKGSIGHSTRITNHPEPTDPSFTFTSWETYNRRTHRKRELHCY